MRATRIISAIIGSLLLTVANYANNIQISNATVTGNNGTASSLLVQFDVSWENSWRGGGVSNWDAAWVFVKVRSNAGLWQHGRLNESGHLAPAGSAIDVGLLTPGTPFSTATNPGIGAFIHRSTDGNGAFSLTGVELSLNYGMIGLNYNDIAEVKVFAVEMVYILQGTYAVGGVGTETGRFPLTTINTANAISPPSGSSGYSGSPQGGYPSGVSAPSNASWPNGFSAFYCMKYELSQQAYVDFLNTLTYSQQVTRTVSVPTSATGTGALVNPNADRNGIAIQTPGQAPALPATYACNLDGNGVFGEPGDGKDIACNWINWRDLSAYLDWSGLRQMTELEFEKACRGTIAPVSNEFAWGDHLYPIGEYTLSNGGVAIEAIATDYNTARGNMLDNVTIGDIGGPVRVGIFASHPSSMGRMTAGSTYYGCMEMSGNLNEGVVTITYGEGFQGLHGNGELTTNGQHDVASWLSGASGVGRKGGSYDEEVDRALVANRGYGNLTLDEDDRAKERGGRGVRNAP